jgi:hypothetical protein
VEDAALRAPLAAGHDGADEVPSSAGTLKAPARGPEWWSSWREAVLAA